MQIRRIALTAAALAAVATGVVGVSSAANAATVHPDAVQADFRFQGVRIFQGPTAGSPVVGLGYIGDGWTSDSSFYAEPYTCADGSSTEFWNHGFDNRTGVAGDVPNCNVTDWA